MIKVRITFYFHALDGCELKSVLMPEHFRRRSNTFI